MKKIANYTLIFALLIFTSGCVRHVGNFTMLATSELDTKHLSKEATVKGKTSGEVKIFILYTPTLIYIGDTPKIDQAVSQALHKCGGDYLSNAQVFYTYWSAILFGKGGYRVEGDCYKINR